MTVNVPAMGDSISEGELKSWAVKAGSTVAMDDLVAEIETDKITVEIRAPKAGVVVEQLAKVRKLQCPVGF
jgi:2-oxoglutarate dehydrogenase E2 component (dihydrolipoamide succinyltransferase)